MAVPTLKVEIAFSVGPHATDAEIAASALGWVDVTDHVQQVEIHRGRESDWEESFTTDVKIVLTNNDRKFDPFNVASPYFNLLNPRRQIKITGTIGATVYPIFRGYVNGFPVTWQDGGKMSTITVDAFDVLALLSANQLKGDLAEIYTRSLSPVHYYRCSDPSGTTTFKDLGSGQKNWTYTNTTSATTTTPVSREFLGIGLSGNSTDWLQGVFQQTITTTPSTTGDASISMWTKTGAAKTRYLFFAEGSSGGMQLVGVVDASGYVGLFYQQSGTSNFRQSKSAGYDSAVAHHYLFTYQKSTGVGQIYIDGVNQTNMSFGANSPVALNFFPLSNFRVYDGVYQEIAVFNKVLSPTEITNLYSFGAGNQVETTSARLSRLLALTDIPSEKYSATLHSSTAPYAYNISGVPEPSAPVIETLNQAQTTEGGYVFVQKDGRIKSTERFYFVGKTVQATFTDDGTDFGYSGDIDVYYDGDNLRNDIVVKYGGQANSQASGLFDPDSIENNGQHTLTIESQSGTADQANALAQFWLRYGILNPPIITAFEVGLSATTAQWETLLGLELLDRIRFKRTPPAGTPFNKQLLINNIDFSLTPKIWSMKISGSSRFTTVFESREAYGIGTSSSSTSFVITDAPEIRSPSSGYTFDTAVLSAEVNAKGTSTNVRIQYGTDASFGTYTEVTPSPSTVTGSSWTAVSFTVTGLTANTTYYYRIKAYNAIATIYGSGGSFTTYRLKLVRFTSSGTWTAPVWGGTPMTAAYYAQLVGGGGSAGQGGGGGGGQASQLNLTLSSSMVGVVGGADGDTTLTNVANTAYGGGYGDTYDLFGGTPNGGDNGQGTFAGGIGYYATFTGYYAGGGGAGAGGAGGNYRSVSGNPVGGHGGAGSITTYYSTAYGGGGAGVGNLGNGDSVYSAFAYGDGAQSGRRSAGLGFILFAYYGPAGNRAAYAWTEGNWG
ncbi:Fibronectin type III [uncultured Caudovirales phage]|uniref:Fibronectin type III n=1 Tax=uncultured Caudovirales phage TaxID=2100421 RepID=A0A6J5RNK0_9CAUD|nr:Fibronectin type III [uncultured Caudovirales phage]CAB4169481.1 Fibronectin type III [uncultured Caudovirales phage]CAB4195857.1 Fibronectin type III [uncultured Caudovirales phage]